MTQKQKKFKFSRLNISLDPKNLNHKQTVKKARKLKQNVGSALKWMQIEEVGENYLTVKHGKKVKMVKGFKIIPHNIFLDAKMDQNSRIARLRNLYNNLNFKIYHAFVFNPVNLDLQISELVSQYESEEDAAIQELIMDDIQKMYIFIDSWKELEFFVMIQETEGKEFDKKLEQLAWELKQSRLGYMPLNKIDFDNYIQYLFENTLLNDFVFSRGDFKVLEGKVEVNENVESL